MPLSEPPGGGDWQAQLRAAIRSPRELAERLHLPPDLVDEAATRDFPLLVPLAYLARMRPGDPHDPLLRQVLPLATERTPTPGFSADPVADAAAALAPGVLQKYARRVLLVTTGACAVHCRYCFRRHYPYAAATARPDQFAAALAAVADDPTVDEVILSGGDPLVLGDDVLGRLVRQLDDIPHLRRLRIHTRLPVVLPDRIDAALADWLAATRLQTVVVLHANHARELDETVAAACRRLTVAGAMLLNQAVLLAGVNNSLVDQRELCLQLGDLGVVPYYLHQLDRVAGAAHFEVALPHGVEIIESLRAELPGYLVPRLVHEVPGAASKVLLA